MLMSWSDWASAHTKRGVEPDSLQLLDNADDKTSLDINEEKKEGEEKKRKRRVRRSEWIME